MECKFIYNQCVKHRSYRCLMSTCRSLTMKISITSNYTYNDTVLLVDKETWVWTTCLRLLPNSSMAKGMLFMKVCTTVSNYSCVTYRRIHCLSNRKHGNILNSKVSKLTDLWRHRVLQDADCDSEFGRNVHREHGCLSSTQANQWLLDRWVQSRQMLGWQLRVPILLLLQICVAASPSAVMSSSSHCSKHTLSTQLDDWQI